jgi:hypothetical protein
MSIPTVNPSRPRLALATLAASLAVVLGGAASASAETWAQHHPRRAEVNERLAIQSYRINRELREGEISFRQARALHAEDRAIRQQERAMAFARGGSISRAEQRLLDREENFVSRQIGR